MDYIALDLEWNGARSERAGGYFNEIIEIGAVRLGADRAVIDTLQLLIKPVICPRLTSLVAGLTNIQEEELDRGIPFEEAAARLRAFIGPRPAAILTWSTTDLLVLLENFRFFYGEERLPFMEAYLDVQAYFQSRRGLPASQQVGLQKAGESLGIAQDELAHHRALDDSRLTAIILANIYEASSFQKALLPTDTAFYERLLFTTRYLDDLSDPLVDKRALQFQCEDCRRNLRRRGDWRYRNRWFFATMVCGKCGGEYTARVQFKQKYDGIDIKRKLLKKPPANQPAANIKLAKEEVS